MFNFENPWIIALAAPLLILIVFLHFKGFEKVFTKLFKYGNPMLKVVNVATRKERRLKTLLLKLLIVMLLTVSLANPYYTIIVKEKVNVETEVKEVYEKVKPAIVIALDVSGSMGSAISGGIKIEAAKQAIYRLLELTPKNISVGFIAFDHRIVKTVPVTSNRELVLETVKELEARGGTMYSFPLRTAFLMLKPYRLFNASTVLIFVTDGLPADRKEYRVILEDFRKYGIPIYTVYIGPGGDLGEEETKFIARETGGEQYTVKTVDQFIKVFEKLANKVTEISFKSKIEYTVEREVRNYLRNIFLASSTILFVVLVFLRFKLTKVSF